MSPRPVLFDLSAKDQARIVEICDQFEVAWIEQEPVSIADTLEQTKLGTRELLLQELISIERHYRSLYLGQPVSNEQLLSDNFEIATEISKLLSNQNIEATQVSYETKSQPSAAPNRRTFFPSLPAEFGRYRVLHQLGEGGMGSVFLASDTQLERHIALKLPQLDYHSDPQLIARFYREAKAAANLNHSNLCAVYDVGEVDGQHFLTMEYIEGHSLDELLKSGQDWTDREVMLLVRQISRALHVAHENGIVHRDLKPANVMINAQGKPVVTDFGLAHRSDDSTSQITHSGQILGTPAYMSPEQVEGDLDRLGPACDVYSLGVMTFQLLTKHRPFEGSTAAILGKIMSEDAPAMATFRDTIDPRLEEIVRRMMAKEIADRYASLQEVLQAIDIWLEAETPIDSPSTREGRSRTPRQAATIVGGLLFAAAIVWGVVLLIQTPSAPLRVVVNDQAVDVLIDQEKISLVDGKWEGIRTSGTHRLALRIGDQELSLNESTTIQLNNEKRTVSVNVAGIQLEGDRFEITRGTSPTAAINIEWLHPPEGVATVANETPSVRTLEEVLAYERQVAQWVLAQHGEVHILLANTHTDLVVREATKLPSEPFYVRKIHGVKLSTDESKGLRQLNELTMLRELKIHDPDIPEDSLNGVHFGPAMSFLDIAGTKIKTSELRQCSGLGNVSAFEVHASQVDDKWSCLELLPRIESLMILGSGTDAVRQLAESTFLPNTKLNYLFLGDWGTSVSEKTASRLQNICPDLSIIQTLDGGRIYVGKPVRALALRELMEFGFGVRARSRFKSDRLFTKDSPFPDDKPFQMGELVFPKELELTNEIVQLLAKTTWIPKITAPSLRNTDQLIEHLMHYSTRYVDLSDSDLTNYGLIRFTSRYRQGELDIRGTSISAETILRCQKQSPMLTIYSDHGTFQPQLIPLQKDSTERELDSYLAYERRVANWVLENGGALNLRLADRPLVPITQKSELPDDAFVIAYVKGLKLNSKQAHEFQQLDNLRGLTRLDFLHGSLSPGMMKGMQFKSSLQELIIFFGTLKTSELADHAWLSNLLEFGVGSSQVDDNWEILSKMPRLRILGIDDPTQESLESLEASEHFRNSDLRLLHLGIRNDFSESIIEEIQALHPTLAITQWTGTHTAFRGNPVQRHVAKELLDMGFTTKPDITAVPAPGENPSTQIWRIEFPDGFHVTPESIELIDRIEPLHAVYGRALTNTSLLAQHLAKRGLVQIELIDSDLQEEDLETLFPSFRPGNMDLRGSDISKDTFLHYHQKYPLINLRTQYGTFGVEYELLPELDHDSVPADDPKSQNE
ncbi:serine/threonine protein kinase [Bremerella alba]|uniref:Serine/threonine-protein kinase PknD n=1 Tax=Bremerella alba TaxID=980252 RepID=A0A7V8V386_9BACT|nr:serine/threonine-protein kinase [Bremerella alba]MBA2114104.1 Serine/threonine-protein kinase PknD [Bremerella alba]